MKAFCMDVHISVIADFKGTCPEVEVVDWCLSSHAWVMKRPQDKPAHINAATWQGINPTMIQRFQNEYDWFLRTFDFFIVGYASCFAMVFEKYNKPVLMLNAVRCDLPFCWTRDYGMLGKYKECIHRLNNKKLLTIVSNSKADQMYTAASLGVRPIHIPSLCLYANIRYNPVRPTFLCYHGDVPEHSLVTHRSTLGDFEWSTIGEFRGIIHFPYEPNTMSIFEHYSGGMPMFFPTKAFWKTIANIQSVSKYWGEHLPRELAEFRDPSMWIESSDVYTTFAGPNTHYFDSFEHLFQLLENFVYVDDRVEREAHIRSVRGRWKRVVENIVSE